MDLTYSDEQTLLKDSAERLIRETYGFEQRRKIMALEDGFSREMWSTFAEMGWLALPIPEAYGGLDGTPVDTMILMEAFGSGAIVEPYLATVVLGAGLLKAAGSKTQKEAILPGVAEGSTLLAVAVSEVKARFNLAHVATTATKQGDGWVLNGAKTLVLHGAHADAIIVPARTSGGETDEAGISLFLVSGDAQGLDKQGYATVDGYQAAELTLTDVALGADALVGVEGAGFAPLSQVVDEAIAALCAESVGAMAVLLNDTVEYTKTRTQFGQPLANFQVLRHRMADMAMNLEEARSMALYAALHASDEDPSTRAKAVSAAKTKVGQCGKFIREQAVQLHGAMGVTDELRVGDFFKRVMANEILFGSVAYHLGRYGKLPATQAAA